MVRLDNSWWKFQRSYDQAGVLAETLQAYIEARPFTLVHETDTESGEYVVRFKVTEPPKAIWSVQLGEIVHDLRSALDHAVWQLILDNGQTPRDGLSGFPVYTDEESFLWGRLRSGGGRTRPGVRLLDGVSPEVRALITDLQPYRAPEIGGEPDQMPLFILNELWNIDKHRLLHLMTVGAEADEFRIAFDVDLEELRVGSRFLKDNTEVARFKIADPDRSLSGNMELNLNTTITVTFDETSVARISGTSVMDVVTKIGNQVRDVLRALSAHAIDRPGRP